MLNHQTHGMQTNKNPPNFQTNNYMLKSKGAIKKDLSSFYDIKDVEVSNLTYDQINTSTACNRNSNSNHSSPLQPRRGMYCI